MPSATATPLSNTRARGIRQERSGFWPAELLADAFSWMVARPCPLCRRLPPLSDGNGRARGLCWACNTRLALPDKGMSGSAPLPWWCSAIYRGAMRQTLLNQKCVRPEAAVIRALLQPLVKALQDEPLTKGPGAALLVPIPGWKRRANPLPGLIADQLGRELGLRRCDLLERCHPVLGQHRLGARLRQANQAGSFRLRAAKASERRRPLLLVDDILTTGATLRHGALCLQEAGWTVLGAVCLARTPARGDWLRTP